MIRALPALQRLEFYANSVRGSIPTILNKLSNLNFLDVEQNKLTGPAFVDVTGLTKLSSYRVSLNELTGTIPENWWQMSTQRSAFPLTEFWFSDNKLIGTIPSSIGDYTQLTSLIMNSNNFQGSLPSELGKLNLLQEFLAYQNLLTSTIPNEFYKDTLLQVLQLQRNILTGTISGQIGDLKALQDLRLGENNFSGSFPPEIAKLSNLGACTIFLINIRGYCCLLTLLSVSCLNRNLAGERNQS